MFKKLFIAVCLVLTVASTFAQKVRLCGQPEMWEKEIQNDPGVAARNALVKRFDPLQFEQYKQRTASGTILYTIPVVIHVMHTYGPDNISKAQCLNAMDILNECFQKRNADTADVIQLFKPIIGDVQCQFRLANIDPAGNCTDGITRTYTTLTNSADNSIKSLIIWNTSKYLNVWVVENIASGAGGYSYLPGVSPSIDGIVIRNDQFGGIGTSGGSTLAKHSFPHEVGHYLNLYHTWGQSNTPGIASNCNMDDGINDTPNTIGTLFGCDTTFNSCGDIANVQNFMDYANCEIMFTEEQAAAMQLALNSSVSSRNNLWAPANLLSTGTEDNHVTTLCAPHADFESTKKYICAGSSIIFRDASWNADITGRTWNFPGGSPATDTAAAVTVTYSVPGTYDVELIAVAANGTDTLIRAGQVTVLPAISANAAPYAEGFETLVLAGSEWAVENPNNNNTWTITNLAAATGTQSIRIQNNTGVGAGNVDALITPSYNTTGVTGVNLTYKIAFAPKVASDTSQLKIYVSNNCGRTWQLRNTQTGSAIHTASPNFAGNWIPSAAQWQSRTLALSPFSNQNNVRIKFEFTNRSANNIYLDDINLNGTVGLNSLTAYNYSLQVYPNPASSLLHITLNPDKSTDLTFELTDLAGRVVYTDHAGKVPAGEYRYELPNNSRLNGMYILHIQAGNDHMQTPVIFTAE